MGAIFWARNLRSPGSCYSEEELRGVDPIPWGRRLRRAFTPWHTSHHGECCLFEDICTSNRGKWLIVNPLVISMISSNWLS